MMQLAKKVTKTLPRGLEKVIQAIFEDAPDHLGFKAVGTGIQGREICAHLDRTVRDSLISLGKDQRYIPDGYFVHLHPTDYDHLRPLFNELRQDALQHLEILCQQLDCQTKAQMSLEFLRSSRTELGEIEVEACFQAAEVRTVLVNPNHDRETGVSFQAEGFEIAKEDAAYYARLIRNLRDGNYKDASDMLNPNLETVLGKTLAALTYFLNDNYINGLRLLNSSPLLKNSEHGIYLRAFAALTVLDADLADQYLQPHLTKHINPMGALIKALIAHMKTNPKEAQTFLDLAESDAHLKHLIHTHLHQLEIQNTSETLVLNLYDPSSNQTFSLCQSLPMGFHYSTERGTLEACSPLKANMALFPKGDHLKVVGEQVTVNHKAIPNGGVVLADGDHLEIMGRQFTYHYSIYHGPWSHTSRRNPQTPLHLLQDQGSPRFWLLNVEGSFNVGREMNSGNDINFENARQMSGSGHGEFHYEHGAFHFTDLGSTNGSAYNNKRLQAHQSCSLSPGNHLLLGNQRLEIH